MATIKTNRDVHSSLPTLAAGEPGWSTDREQLWIGNGTDTPGVLIGGQGGVRGRYPNGRLTGTTASPLSDTDGGSTLYYTPLTTIGLGDTIWLYSTTKSKWDLYTFTEASIAASGLSVSTVYDIFAYWDSGSLALEAVAWSSSTARATALANQDGMFVKSGNAARLYVGTVHCSSSGTIHDKPKDRGIWNLFNQSWRRLSVTLSGSGYTYNTAAWRAVNNDSGNRFEFTAGLASFSKITAEIALYVDATGTGTRYAGLALNSTTTSNATHAEPVSKAEFEEAKAYYHSFLPLGNNYLQATEYGAGSGTNTWYPQYMAGWITA